MPPTPGRIAVVTGGGTGIGAACARRFATDGCAVVIVGRRSAVLERTAEAIRAEVPAAVVVCEPADVAEPDDVQALAARVAARFEHVDILVNNAGAPATAHNGELAALAAAWIATYRVNTVGPVLVTTALEPLLPRPGGRVILVGSSAARTGGASPAYVAAKAALEGYLRATAARLGPHGVTVNLVAPGFTDDTELLAGRVSSERRARLVSGIALGRAAEPWEIAGAVAFLASAEAGYLTGEVVTVDGGHASWAASR